MKKILVLGAGHSSPFLISCLLKDAEEHDWRVTVGDRDAELAASRIEGHPRGEARSLDVKSVEDVSAALAEADLVVNLMPPELQRSIAHECLRGRTHMLSVSYATPDLLRLTEEARELGVLMLFELGVDPGIDHMASMALLDRVRSDGGVIESFESYGGGLPAPGSTENPLGYAVTWNPRNVVLAGSEGALFVRDGRVHALTPARVFEDVWSVDVVGFGRLEAYANRDSLSYVKDFGLEGAHTVIRATLRNPGWCETWRQIGRLGLNCDTLAVPGLGKRSFAELLEMLIPRSSPGDGLEERVAQHLGLDMAGAVMRNLRWLGLFEDRPIGASAGSFAGALSRRLEERLVLSEGGRDAVILQHEVEIDWPDRGRQRLRSSLVEYGEPGGTSAMARTVGLPTGIASRLLLERELQLTGCHRPTERAIYEPILAELAKEGLEFEEEEIT